MAGIQIRDPRSWRIVTNVRADDPVYLAGYYNGFAHGYDVSGVEAIERGRSEGYDSGFNMGVYCAQLAKGDGTLAHILGRVRVT